MLNKYQIAYVNDSGEFEVIHEFFEGDDRHANEYAQQRYGDADWYVLDETGRNINGEAPLRCSICRKPIPAEGPWTQGHNAQPVNDGRCCGVCNDTVVIPARLNEFFSRSKVSK